MPNVKGRLRQLERQQQTGGKDPYDDWYTFDEWLAAFEEAARAGEFAAEPDYPAAVQEYREGLEAAKGGQPSPDIPAPDFRIGLTPRGRLIEWQHQHHWPALSDAL